MNTETIEVEDQLLSSSDHGEVCKILDRNTRNEHN